MKLSLHQRRDINALRLAIDLVKAGGSVVALLVDKNAKKKKKSKS